MCKHKTGALSGDSTVVWEKIRQRLAKEWRKNFACALTLERKGWVEVGERNTIHLPFVVDL